MSADRPPRTHINVSCLKNAMFADASAKKTKKKTKNSHKREMRLADSPHPTHDHNGTNYGKIVIDLVTRSNWSYSPSGMSNNIVAQKAGACAIRALFFLVFYSFVTDFSNFFTELAGRRVRETANMCSRYCHSIESTTCHLFEYFIGLTKESEDKYKRK